MNCDEALQVTPCAIRSVYLYPRCVPPEKQNMSIMPKYKAAFYYIKIPVNCDEEERIYRHGIKAGVDGLGQLSVSMQWPDDNQFMCAVNGDLSFNCLEHGDRCAVDSHNRLDDN